MVDSAILDALFAEMVIDADPDPDSSASLLYRVETTAAGEIDPDGVITGISGGMGP